MADKVMAVDEIGEKKHCRQYNIYYSTGFNSSVTVALHTDTLLNKDVNESRNARVSKKILVLENLISRRARNSRTHKAKLHD